MRIVDTDEIDRLLDFPALIDALADAFRGGMIAPPRQHHEISLAERVTHLIMPAWTSGTPGPGAFLGAKLVNVFPSNAAHGLPAVLGVYVLQSGETGAPLAIIDGTRLTHWRTAAASALAARHLARPDASRLTMVGAGALAPFLVRAHASVRPISDVTLWNHRRASAERLAVSLTGPWRLAVADDLESAVRAADIVSCATLSDKPLVRGAWLTPGTHVDLVGAFNLRMREADDESIQRARVFIDTADAKTMGGDIALALRAGAIEGRHIEADLFELCSGAKEGRVRPDEITLFKSVGASIEDLAAAILVWKRLGRPA